MINVTDLINVTGLVLLLLFADGTKMKYYKQPIYHTCNLLIFLRVSKHFTDKNSSIKDTST